MKETFIIICVVSFVTASSIFLQNYLSTTSNDILQNLNELKEAMKNENIEVSKSISKEILEKWKEINKYWSMIVIHQELDQIELSIIGVNASITAEEIR